MSEIQKLAIARDEQSGHTEVAAHGHKRPYGSAILSLLVAADQRCPAIIGQAHILYHDRFAAEPGHAERTFRQLKRDAADLFKAIAAVEAAMDESISEVE